MKEILSTQNAPQAIGPYSQGIDTGSLVFLSGQIPIDPSKGDIMAKEIAGQTRQVLENIKAILESGGCCMEQVVKTTVYLLAYLFASCVVRLNRVVDDYRAAELVPFGSNGGYLVA